MKCPICGKDVELQKKQVGVDEQGAPVFHQYAVCRDCKKQWNLDKQRARKSVPDTAADTGKAEASALMQEREPVPADHASPAKPVQKKPSTDGPALQKNAPESAGSSKEAVPAAAADSPRPEKKAADVNPPETRQRAAADTGSPEGKAKRKAAADAPASEEKARRKAAEGHPSADGKSTHRPASNNASAEEKAARKSASGGASAEEKKAHRPSSGSVSAEEKAVHKPVSGGVSAEGKKAHRPTSGSVSAEEKAARRPSSGSASAGEKAVRKPVSGNASAEGKGLRRPDSGEPSSEGKASRKPEDGSVPSEARAKRRSPAGGLSPEKGHRNPEAHGSSGEKAKAAKAVSGKHPSGGTASEKTAADRPGSGKMPVKRRTPGGPANPEMESRETGSPKKKPVRRSVAESEEQRYGNIPPEKVRMKKEHAVKKGYEDMLSTDPNHKPVKKKKPLPEEEVQPVKKERPVSAKKRPDTKANLEDEYEDEDEMDYEDGEYIEARFRLPRIIFGIISVLAAGFFAYGGFFAGLDNIASGSTVSTGTTFIIFAICMLVSGLLLLIMQNRNTIFAFILPMLFYIGAAVFTFLKRQDDKMFLFCAIGAAVAGIIFLVLGIVSRNSGGYDGQDDDYDDPFEDDYE